MSNSNSVLLEVAIASLDDAVTVQQGGADRLELNSALALGGLTPSLGTLIEIKAAVNLPVMAMVRPRPGGFRYSKADFAVMQRDVDLLLEHGADGIVFGILHETGKLDLERCRQLIEQVGGRQIVLHRAFDVVPDPFATLEEAIELGFHRIMTSGQESSASDGASLIAELNEQSSDRIEILPAGGIRSNTVTDVIAATGCNQVHGSLRERRDDCSAQARPHISFSNTDLPPEHQYDVTSLEGIAAMKAITDGDPDNTA